MAMFNSYVKLPEGKNPLNPMKPTEIHGGNDIFGIRSEDKNPP